MGVKGKSQKGVGQVFNSLLKYVSRDWVDCPVTFL